MNDGEPMRFGDPAQIKRATEICSRIRFTKKAIVQLHDRYTPKEWQFRGKAVDVYINQFDDRKLWKNHNYTYGERLLEYEIPNPNYPKTLWKMMKYVLIYGKLPPVTVKLNQFDEMRKQLAASKRSGVCNNRTVAITWQPWKDQTQRSVPCLLVLQIRLLKGDAVSIRALFRSHDFGQAYIENVELILAAVMKYVVAPNRCRVTEIVLDSWSAHVYDGDRGFVDEHVTKLA